jgi:hypothetical protein
MGAEAVSVVQVINPPHFETKDFELCYAESLGLIVHCKVCQIMVLLWDDARQLWLDCEDFPYQFYSVRCWGGCGNAVHRPSVQQVRRFKEKERHERE